MTSSDRLALIRKLALKRNMVVASLPGFLPASRVEIEQEFSALTVNRSALVPAMESTSDDSGDEPLSESLAAKDLAMA